MQITYRDGGPSYYVNDYFPHFHYQTAAELAGEDYELLIEYWGKRENTDLDDLVAGSDVTNALTEESRINSTGELDLD